MGQSTCCCCIAIRPGVIMIAIICMVWTIFQMAGATLVFTKEDGFIIQKVPNVTQAPKVGEENDPKAQEERARKLAQAMLVVQIVFFSASLLLLFGACCHSSCLLWPFIIISVLVSILIIIAFVINVITVIQNNLHWTEMFEISSMGPFGVPLTLYFTSVVVSARHEIGEP